MTAWAKANPTNFALAPDINSWLSILFLLLFLLFRSDGFVGCSFFLDTERLECFLGIAVSKV